MEENKNSAISVRNVCIDYKSLKTGSIKQNFFKLKKVERKWKVYDASCNRRNFLCG